MPTEIDFEKAYVAAEHEPKTYQKWESSGAFSPHADQSKPAFSMVMPPPNANGNLHIGHALMIPLEDIMVRYHRMKGDRTLWVPGSDHAGIETQVVFERYLEKQGTSRFKMTREQFYKECYAFTQENKKNMEAQVRALGASVDWSAERFTLDPLIVEQVYATFRRMYADGLIYRGERIVNYSVKYQTAYSDIEVLHEERQEPLYYLKYGPITVATVRPETKFGDKTIVVHPDDERYQRYVGTSFKAMTVTGEEAEFTVIADQAIKPEFGTGAMTITPAHDPIDFEIAQRHNLPINKIIGLDGRLLPIAGEFAGMKVAEARTKVGLKMQELGMVEKVDETYRHTIGLCYKSNQPIEPMLMPQWFVKVAPLAEKAIAAIEAGEVKFLPESYKQVEIDWLKNLRDWNISRQIWWGIPIKDAMPDNLEVANDPDSFDTWFSSAQWPYVTMQALNTPERNYLEEFYSNSVLETGRDILFQWVSRMLMLGLYVHGKVPFKTVYLHGMVVDSKGKKMSKSKNNGVSPMDFIPKYGADALRFGLLVGSSAGSDVPMPLEKVIGGRNFANKVWNISRFVLMQLEGVNISSLPKAAPVTDADKLILEQLQAAIRDVTDHIEKFRFAQGLQSIHEFFWHQFADVYIEAAKSQVGAEGNVTPETAAILWHSLVAALKLLHPFMPFVTEAIYQRLPERDGMLMTSPWPQ
jgi:valyl-tRNA synthetase